MKENNFRIFLPLSAFLLLGSQQAFCAWNVPPASKPVCAECRGEDGHHKESCPYYVEHSTKLKDYTPLPEIPHIPSTCPFCKGRNGSHKSDCNIGYGLKRIQHYREKYDEARTKKDRDYAVFNLKRWNENIENMIKRSEEEEEAREEEEWKKKAEEKWQKRHSEATNKPPLHKPTIQNNPPINIPQTQHSVSGTIPNDYDKKITFHNVPGALTAYGKVNQNGKEEWHFYDKNGRDKFGFDFAGIDTVEYGNQHYFIAKNSYMEGYSLLDANGNGLGNYSNLKPIRKAVSVKDKDLTGAKGTETRLMFICLDRSGYKLFDPVRKTASNVYDSIDTSNINPNYPMIKVMNKGYYGIVSPLVKDFVASDGRIFTKDTVIVPLEYTYVKERYTQKEKLPYYIVSKDSQHFGAYNANGKMVLPLKYSFAQVEERIDKRNFRNR